MSLRQVRRRRRMTITSLIDVIFLLLLFFMLASTFSKFSEIDLSVQASGDGRAAPSVSDSLALRIEADQLRLNGVALPLQDLPGQLGLSARGEPVQLFVHVSEEVTTQRFVDVLQDLSAFEGLALTVMEPDA